MDHHHDQRHDAMPIPDTNLATAIDSTTDLLAEAGAANSPPQKDETTGLGGDGGPKGKQKTQSLILRQPAAGVKPVRRKKAKPLPLVQHVGKKRMTTSRAVAQEWGREHRTVMTAVDKQLELIEDKQFNAQNFLQNDYVDSAGRTQREWLMTEAGFAAVAMGFTGKLSANLRVRFVQAFEKAAQRITVLGRQAPEWKEARQEVAETHSMAMMVLQATREREGKETKGYHYANEAALLSFAMTGRSKPPVNRQALNAAQLKVLKATEKRNAQLLLLGKPYDERKAACRELVESRMALLPAPGRAAPTPDATSGGGVVPRHIGGAAA